MTAFCQRIVAARWFQPVIIGVIIAAGALVGLETYPELQQRFGAWFKGLDSLIVAIFVVEIALKMGAHGRQSISSRSSCWARWSCSTCSSASS